MADNESVQGLFQFGRDGCSSIAVRPFTPICSHPDISGSQAMSITIPVPTYVPITPPHECVCFEFDGEDGDATVSTDCENVGGTIRVEITPSEDCCAGLYTITPHLDITVPCIPFDMKDASSLDGSISVSNKSGDKKRGIDGGVVALKLRNGDEGGDSSDSSDKCRCEVQPVIDIKFPDCIKGYDGDAIPNDQITYCAIEGDKVVTKTHKLITMVQDPENCSLYPRVTPFEIPCCTQLDREWKITRSLSDKGGSITLTVNRNDCDLDFKLAVSPIQIPNPVVNVVGSAFGNGGDVFLDAGNNNLYLNGATASGDTTWYGGGIGNLNHNTDADEIYCRGPKMRNEEDLAADDIVANLPIPYDTINVQRLTTSDGGNMTSKWSSSRKGQNSRGEDIKETTPEDGYAFGNLDMVIPSGFQWHQRGVAAVMSHFLWESGGLLSLTEETDCAVLLSPAPTMWPTDNSLGVLSGRNASGLGIDFEETGALSGIGVHFGNGLRIVGRDFYGNPDTGYTGETDRIGRLEVNCCDGLRIFGYKQDGTRKTAESASDDKFGKLQVDCGNGMRVFGRTDEGTTSSTEASDTANANRIGRIEVYGHNRDFMLDNVTGGVSGRLMLNDQKSSPAEGSASRWDGSKNSGFWLPYCRKTDGDYSIPVLVAGMTSNALQWTGTELTNGTDSAVNLRPNAIIAVNNNLASATKYPAYINELTNGLWGLHYELGYGEDDDSCVTTIATALADIHDLLFNSLTSVVNVLSQLRAMYIHVGNAGIITGIDADATGAAVPRRVAADALKPSPDVSA